MRLGKIALSGLLALVVGAAALPALAPVLAQEKAGDGGEHQLLVPNGGWKHEGYFGKFDQNSLQRGFKVYREVCSSCHGLKLLSFRNLGQPGGPFYMPEFPNPVDNPKVKQIAIDFPHKVRGIDVETGDPEELTPKPSDHIPGPYPNDTYGRAQNGGALPPDLSVIVKARNGEASYVYSLLQGFVDPPAGLTVNPGQHYNKFFAGDTASQWAGDPRTKPPGGFLAMTPPLTADGLVTFDDDTPSTREQMARDVATFLAWASDPKMEVRKQMGVAVLAYLLILAVITFLSYRAIWRNVEH